MNLWFTRRDAKIVQTHVKRFDPPHWSVDFPRGTIASMVTAPDGHGLTVHCEFLGKGDLVGLIWDSEDRLSHPAHVRETSRDYSRCKLSFAWQSSGVVALDALDGPTLTIEGEDAEGNSRSWFVRLWNYAQGTPTDATITLDFDALDGGFDLPEDADRVDPTRIDRMFISLVAPGYVEGSTDRFAAPVAATVSLTDIRCEGSGSVLAINDAVMPEHEVRIATAYDDLYNLAPERIVDAVERLGYRQVVSHYIGMSHFFGLTGAGELDTARTFNAPALAWHRDLARAMAARGYELIWSLSYEILDMFCPAAWKQRAFDGSAALTGWDPPSALLSAANSDAMGFLQSVAAQLVAISEEAGLQPRVQIGEPWWWVRSDGAICVYDAAATAALGGSPVEIADVRGPLNAAQRDLLDQAGALLAASTAAIASSVKSTSADAETLLLAYLPTVLDPAAPELKRANLPLGWAKPAFDVLQLEDYEWVTSGSASKRDAAYATVDARLGYPIGERHYYSGFVPDASERAQWRDIVGAAADAQMRGTGEVFLWALPQVLRDGLTIFGKEQDVAPFEDVIFPIEIGQDASVAPGFSTNVVASASGFETRNANWAVARLRFDAGPGVRGEAELETLLAFFRARRGPAIAFRFRDPFDHSSHEMTGAPQPDDQQIGTGDGILQRFELTKSYGGDEARRITRPAPGTVRVALNGAELTSGWMLQDKGTIEFAVPPAAGAVITAGFLFDVPVRFAQDQLEVNRATFMAGEAPSVPLIEVRER